VYFDGAVYHVYNRLARGERVFAEEEVAEWFVELLREVTGRDGVTVFAWALLPNHYHLALRAGPVPLERPMKSLQQRTTRLVNARNRVFGPLWQGRYRAKLVKDQRYFDQLLVYIHLNPVIAGLAEDPADYRWCGHRELLKKSANPVIDADEVLRLFGNSRRSARAAYVRALRAARDAEWIGEDPGFLPWWRLGRPPRSEAEDPDATGRDARIEAEERRLRERPRLAAGEFLRQGGEVLGIGFEELAGRGKLPEVVRARELLTVLGVERYDLRVKDMAAALGKHPQAATGWMMRGVRRRHEDAEEAICLEEIDVALSGHARGEY
jgi:REP element-mobilizing transposase RayT